MHSNHISSSVQTKTCACKQKPLFVLSDFQSYNSSAAWATNPYFSRTSGISSHLNTGLAFGFMGFVFFIT